MKITIISQDSGKLVIESPKPFKITDRRKTAYRIFDCIPDSKDDTTYGYPLEKEFVGYLYNILITNGYIDTMDYNSFLYYFNCNAPKPRMLDKIHWLKPSREGVRILLLKVFDRFLSHDRHIKKLQKDEIDRLTQLFWLNHKNKPLSTYVQSGGYSRSDADTLEEILVRLIDSYYSMNELFTKSSSSKSASF